VAQGERELMRISLCNEVIGELPFGRQCEVAATLGYDGLEIAPVTLTDDPTRLTAAQIAEWRRAASDHGPALSDARAHRAFDHLGRCGAAPAQHRGDARAVWTVCRAWRQDPGARLA
jgi:hypothetical protein